MVVCAICLTSVEYIILIGQISHSGYNHQSKSLALRAGYFSATLVNLTYRYQIATQRVIKGYCKVTFHNLDASYFNALSE